jgi:hypothetical protein
VRRAISKSPKRFTGARKPILKYASGLIVRAIANRAISRALSLDFVPSPGAPGPAFWDLEKHDRKETFSFGQSPGRGGKDAVEKTFRRVFLKL